LNIKKKPITLKINQDFGVETTLDIKERGEKRALWGQIQHVWRKGYIMGGCIYRR
jgi:hypothetical protein